MLAHNQIDHCEPLVGPVLVEQSLDLSFNKLTALPPSWVELTVLKDLDLRNNSFESLPDVLTDLVVGGKILLANNPLVAEVGSFQVVTIGELDCSS